MSPTVRIDDDVYEKLKQQAEPFVDTPNTVLRRLLGLEAPASAAMVDSLVDREPEPEMRVPKPAQRRASRSATRGSKKPKRTRAPNGSLLPETEYDRPLLEALVELGGAAPSRAVTDAVGERLKDRLTALDREKLPSGGIRWENRLQFVRLRLIEKGWMIKESGRGIWAVSDEGRKYIAADAQDVA